MSAGWLLLGLLAIAFVGSSVARGRGVVGFGLPSGSEWLLSGVLVGPQLFGLAGPNELKVFAPLIAAGSGYVAMTVGQRFGLLFRTEGLEPDADRAGLLAGVFGAFITATVVAAVAYGLLGRLMTLSTQSRIATAWSLGIALAPSTRQLIDWARERLGASGRLTDFLEARISGTEVVALLGIAPITALFTEVDTSKTALLVRTLFPVLLGLLLGGLALGLLRYWGHGRETWGVLLGAFLLTTGLCLRLGASVITAGFILGVVLGQHRRLGRTLRRLTHPTEGAVVLPLLVIAGASVDWVPLGRLAFVVLAVVFTRLLVQLGFAWMLRNRGTSQPASVFALGLTFNASGEVTCLIVLGIWLVSPTPIGQMALALVVIASLVGELLSARSLRALLTVEGDVKQSADSERIVALTDESKVRGTR